MRRSHNKMKGNYCFALKKTHKQNSMCEIFDYIHAARHHHREQYICHADRPVAVNNEYAVLSLHHVQPSSSSSTHHPLKRPSKIIIRHESMRPQRPPYTRIEKSNAVQNRAAAAVFGPRPYFVTNKV